MKNCFKEWSQSSSASVETCNSFTADSIESLSLTPDIRPTCFKTEHLPHRLISHDCLWQKRPWTKNTA